MSKTEFYVKINEYRKCPISGVEVLPGLVYLAQVVEMPKLRVDAKLVLIKTPEGIYSNGELYDSKKDSYFTVYTDFAYELLLESGYEPSGKYCKVGHIFPSAYSMVAGNLPELVSENQDAWRGIGCSKVPSECEGTDVKDQTFSYNHINPDHYKQFSIETIDMMVAIWGAEAVATHCELCAFKYRMRVGDKPGQPVDRDFGKIQWYLDKAKELRNE